MRAPLLSAVVVLSGNELLDGRVRDANGAWISADLSERGVAVRSVHVVADDLQALVGVVRFALAQEPDLLILSGGLGATHDDLTARALADVLGVALEEDAVALAMVQDGLRDVARRRGVDVSGLLDTARRQALHPAGSVPLAPAGVAPGIAVEHGRTRIIALPGVPHEFRTMWTEVAHALKHAAAFPSVAVRTMRIFGCGEATVTSVLETVPFDLIEVGITAEGGEVTVKLRYPTVVAAAAAQADAVAVAVERHLPVYDGTGRTVADVVADLLVERGQTLAVAESCTGGALGARIVDRPGSSAYFRGGVISYANDVKEALLGVPAQTLAHHGAVSEEVAGTMAQGVRSRCQATWGLSVTGIAGPDGGSEEKPVGLVYVGCSGPSRSRVVRERFTGDRETIRAYSVNRALHLLREELTTGAAPS